MQPRLQNTIAKPVEFRGRGLFHGFDVKANVLPAAADTGIVFRRTDLVGSPDIPACCESITTVPRRTVLASADGVQVETVEHLMAALAGLQIDNCVVEIDAVEVPAYDGSCLDFCHGLLDAGLQQLDQPIAQLSIEERSEVKGDGSRQSLVIRPYIQRCAAFTYHLDYGIRSTIAAQVFSFELSTEAFVQQIAPARTFILESEIKALQSMGYGKHLTAKDIVVVGPKGVIDNELRWANEGVRHKILDCIGDLALSGLSFNGHITAFRSGHHLNHKMAKELVAMKTSAERFSRAA